ncbi:acyl carrier protein [Streptomyces griseosporeus]|uniref:acyl carrier protein n=1 Tax=Streptomyces griseosporeus TaxID=1910 RepID=UPI0036FB7CE3
MAHTHATRIREFITGRHPQAELTDTQDIFSLGFINSLFAMELVMFIEKEFAVSLPNDELRIDNFRTIAAMSELVERRLAATASAA